MKLLATVNQYRSLSDAVYPLATLPQEVFVPDGWTNAERQDLLTNKYGERRADGTYVRVFSTCVFITTITEMRDCQHLQYRIY